MILILEVCGAGHGYKVVIGHDVVRYARRPSWHAQRLGVRLWSLCCSHESFYTQSYMYAGYMGSCLNSLVMSSFLSCLVCRNVFDFGCGRRVKYICLHSPKWDQVQKQQRFKLRCLSKPGSHFHPNDSRHDYTHESLPCDMA